jgi:hypothetical protein
MFSNKNPAISSYKYSCDICHFYSHKKSNFNEHLSTRKHIEAINSNENPAISSQNYPKYCCSNCGRVYKDNSGLWRHKKKCTNISIQDLDNEEKQQQLIEYLLKENSEFKQMMMEQNKHMVELAKNAGHNIHNTTNNNNNNSFNLQFFLNETCKDAMNIMDFVSQLQVGTKDLEETGRLGFANGISKLFINGLKQININDRPIHCSDSKRETLYIKSNNEWNKEGEDKLILTNALKHVAHKHMNKILDWTKEHPNCRDPDSRENDKYLRIVSEAMPGSTAEESSKNYTKIIKNIVKETVIEK